MPYGECPFATEACKYFTRDSVPGGNTENGCYSDRDHIVPQRLATTALARAYIHSPENYQQLCRNEHDVKTLGGDEPLPEKEVMAQSVLRQAKIGKIAVARALRRKIAKGKLN